MSTANYAMHCLKCRHVTGTTGGGFHAGRRGIGRRYGGHCTVCGKRKSKFVGAGWIGDTWKKVKEGTKKAYGYAKRGAVAAAPYVIPVAKEAAKALYNN